MIGEAEAIRRATEFLESAGTGVFEFSSAVHQDSFDTKGRMEWRVVFRNADERYKQFGPTEAWVLIDAEDGSACLFPVF
jgi:hypothetical protein